MASKKAEAIQKTASKYRAQHEKIPGKIYTFTRRSTQQTARGLVRKTNYAPLGRPPSDHVAFGKYYAASKVLTPYAKKKVVKIGDAPAKRRRGRRTKSAPKRRK